MQKIREMLFPVSLIPLLENVPWSSPNVWEEVTTIVDGKTRPSIFEFGTGVSTIWHIRSLLQKNGGEYFGVEHDKDWWAIVVAAIIEECGSLGLELDLKIISNQNSKDAYINIIDPKISIKLYYRSSENVDNSFEEYLNVLSSKMDIIIVDGKERVKCIEYILKNNLIKENGVLTLFEAGRGQEGWLGYPKLQGGNDYSQIVNELLSLGGYVLDGDGLDSWPQLRGKRRGYGMQYKNYPYEALFLKRIKWE